MKKLFSVSLILCSLFMFPQTANNYCSYDGCWEGAGAASNTVLKAGLMNWMADAVFSAFWEDCIADVDSACAEYWNNH